MLRLTMILSFFLLTSMRATALASSCSEDLFYPDDVGPLHLRSIAKLTAQTNSEALQGQLIEVAKAAKLACPTQNLETCPTSDLAQAAEQLKFTKLVAALKYAADSPPGIFARRSAVVATWLVSIIGPAALTAHLTKELDPLVSTVLVAMVFNISNVFSYNLGLPLYRYGPIIASYVMKAWGPEKGDHWGQSQLAVNETERVVMEHATTQLLILGSYIEVAGAAVLKRQLPIAADKYVSAIVQSFHSFNGSLLGHGSLVEKVRESAEFFNNLTDDELLELKSHIIAKCATLPADRLPDQIPAAELAATVSPVLDLWFRRGSD